MRPGGALGLCEHHATVAAEASRSQNGSNVWWFLMKRCPEIIRNHQKSSEIQLPRVNYDPPEILFNIDLEVSHEIHHLAPKKVHDFLGFSPWTPGVAQVGLPSTGSPGERSCSCHLCARRRTNLSSWDIPSTNGGFKLGQIIYNRLVLWNMTLMTFHILGIVTPTDFHIFQRGWSHQPDNVESIGAASG